MSNWDVESGDRAALLRTMLEEPTPENHRRSASQELRDIENQYRSQPSTQKIYYGEAVLADVLKAEKEADLAHKNYLLSSGESLQFGDVEVRATLNVKNELHLNEMGLIEGVGSKLYIKSGKKVEGVFENGKLVNGLISLPDGTYEKGIFRNGGLINGKRFCAKTGIEFLGKFYSGGCLIDGRKYHPAQKNLINHTPQGHDKFKTTILYPSGAVKSKGVFFNSNGRLAKGEKYSEVGELLQSGEFSKENGQLLEGTSHKATKSTCLVILNSCSLTIFSAHYKVIPSSKLHGDGCTCQRRYPSPQRFLPTLVGRTKLNSDTKYIKFIGIENHCGN